MGGEGCQKLVPASLERDSTKNNPPGYRFDQILGEMSCVRGKLSYHIGDHIVPSPVGYGLVTSLEM